ncbi:DsbA family protein [Sphingomonas bacterium]|uniref:DsbA family protein n=1 Tax=Sphingomonas bacterium TaxID=1895847 RepID=UPI00157620CB|nr:DsbA family protein [Sphingomonas bacterium]
MRNWILPAVAAVAGGVGVWGYDRFAAPGGAEQVRIERIVHNYVLTHPEIVSDAMHRLQDRDTAAAIAANRAAITAPVGDAWAGNAKGDVTVVEYYDYNCGYCRASLPIIDQLVASDPNVRVVFRDLPILAPSSGVAAQMSIAAARAGRFKPFHDALYAAGPVTDATIAASARKAGLDPATLNRDAQSPAVVDTVRANLATQRALGLTGTPSFVIGNRLLTGAQPLADLQAAIADARKRGA